MGEVDNAETSKRFRSAVDESLTHLVCAITQELPLDPVTAEDGNIYEPRLSRSGSSSSRKAR